MPRPRTFSAIVAALAFAALAHPALAQVETTYTFENFPANTNVTTQYRGVTFERFFGASSQPLRIRTMNNTSSPTRALSTVYPGDEFSPAFMRMVFSQPQRQVRFAVGTDLFCNAPNNVIRVRAYNAAGTLLTTQDVRFNVAGPNTLVSLGSNTGPFEIKRIDIDGTVPGFCNWAGEAIDDLTFLPDTTPPVVTITAPAEDACVCGNTFTITGTACDLDGLYASDRLEYGPSPSGPWTTVASFTPQVCSNGTLYNWDTAGLPGGVYYIRVSARNADGWESSIVRRIYLDKTPPSIDLRSPAASPAGIYSGSVCFDGTVNDVGCQFGSWIKEWRPAGGTTWTAIGTPGTSAVSNDPLGAAWNIASRPDGAYEVRVVATDSCGLSTTLGPRTVIVDNTPPVGLITDPLNCAEVFGTVIIRGTASDANLSGWTLQVVGGNWHSWQTIATGTSNVVNGVLGTFNANANPACAYAVRLIVTDRSVVGCGPGTQSTEYVTTIGTVPAGSCDDIDFNNDGVSPSTDDIEAFLRVFGGGAC